jgi:hypothetical protein
LGGKYKAREWKRKNRKNSWGRTTDCSTRKRDKVKGVRTGIRKQ